MLRTRIVAFALAVAALAGCGDSQGPGGTAQFSVKLTDAPGPFTAAVVTISEVSLLGAGGKVTLSSTPTTVNLLDLQNATLDLVKDAEVPTGTYQELRLVITGGYVQLTDGTIFASSPNYAGLPQGATVTGQLKMPSLAQSGLKVTLPGSALAVTGPQKIVLIDFNVSQSFGHDAGNSGSWVMHPVIKGADIQTTGSVAVSLTLANGVTLPQVNGKQVTLADFSATLGTETMALDATGHATFQFVVPDTYPLSFTGPAGVTFVTDPVATSATPIQVTVPSGQAVSVSATITSATSP
ncbi:MAG TPA: DUF4382 domain-containing protein [Gemmatimonadales bacterium]|nr:DUF4382 domain-containing protein [Gemmatimonadales bacterium]